MDRNPSVSFPTGKKGIFEATPGEKVEGEGGGGRKISMVIGNVFGTVGSRGRVTLNLQSNEVYWSNELYRWQTETMRKRCYTRAWLRAARYAVSS